MTAANRTTYPSTSLYPSLVIGGPDMSGNPTGWDESSFWANIDVARPDALRWLAVDLLTGSIVCDLPGILSTDPIRRTLGRYESMTVNLAVTDRTSPSWLTGTRPGASALIAYRGQPGSEVIYWGGIVLRRKRTLGGSLVELTLATPECYADRRYTGAYTTDTTPATAQTRNQNTVVSDLISQFCAANQGLPITVTTVDNGQPVPSILAVYNDYDDKTVYSNLGTLMGALNGPEWTAHWQWDRNANTIKPVFYVGNHIGAVVPSGLAPRAFFDSANLIDADLQEDYSSGMGANDVTATSSGQGLARPQASYPSPPATSLNGRPRWQYRYQPSTSIRDTLTLSQHAQRAYNLLAEGTNTITLHANATSRPYLGVDWDLGDDIGYALTGPAFPDEFTGTARCIGYEADDRSTSPVLYVPTVI